MFQFSIFAAMFSGLQQKWKVNGWRVFLIIATFALGGSLCGYTGRCIMPAFHIAQPVLWAIIYLLLITLLWPLCVVIVSIPLGQFVFFRQYLLKIGARMSMTTLEPSGKKYRIAIFASGTGTNAARIIEYTKEKETRFTVALVVCNKPGACVLKVAEKNAIPALMIDKEKFFRGNAYTDELKGAGIDFIVLAGFLWKIPVALVQSYRNRIINIHPALLPKYGGKGMYGSFVHEAVIANGEPETGITIHWVDEQYDHGSTIFQAKCPVLPGDSPSSLAARIHELEHKHYPEIVEKVITEMTGGR